MKKTGRKFVSIFLAIAMVMTSIVISPAKADADSVKEGDAKEVSVSQSGGFTEHAEITESGQYILYKVSLTETGIYSFFTSGEGVDTIGYLLNESQLGYFDEDHCLKENDDINDDNYNCGINMYFQAGDIVYFAVRSYDTSTEFDVTIGKAENCVEKDGILYEKIEGTGSSAWSVMGYIDPDISRAVIPGTIEGVPVTTIGYQAFYSAPCLSEVFLPDTIKIIGRRAFASTRLEEIIIPESCTTIAYQAFGDTAIKELSFPKNVSSFDINDFWMASLEKITVAEDNETFSSIDGILYSKDKTKLMLCPAGKDTSVYNVAEGTKIIGTESFSGQQKIDKIVLPDTVETIESFAFLDSKISGVDMGNSVKTVGTGAFWRCDNLNFLDFPESVIKIGTSNCRPFINMPMMTVIIRNSSCEISSSLCDDDQAITMYGIPTSTAEIFASDKDNVTFVALDESGCTKEPAKHQFVEYYKKVPTCTEQGVMGTRCANCGTRGESHAINPLGHTCGYTNHICDRCYEITGEVKKLTLEQKVLVEEADFGEAYSAAYVFRPENPGQYTISLSLDKYYVNTEIYVGENYLTSGPAGEADLSNNNPATISVKKGESVYIRINKEDSVETSGLEITAFCKHAQTEIKTTPATCTEAGKKETVCTSCGKVMQTELVPASNHDFGTNEATCKKCGVANPGYIPSEPDSVVSTDMPETVTEGKVTYQLDKNGEYVAAKAKKSAVKKLLKKAKGFQITWQKVSKVTGYQVQYSTSKKFTKKTTKQKTYQGNKKFTKKVSKLKAKKTYYVRVRTYMTKKINGKTVKLYSGWSKAKSVKTKK